MLDPGSEALTLLCNKGPASDSEWPLVDASDSPDLSSGSTLSCRLF